MFERISYTFSLMGASWRVLKKDKELLLFPILSGLCCVLVIASFAIPFLATGYWKPPAEGASQTAQVTYYALLFVFYVCNYFVMFFFNSAVIACAVVRMRGGNPTVKTGLQAAFARIHLIFAWAVVSATVGLVLRIIEDRSKRAGAIVAAILGTAWSVVTFLVVPVLVVENAGPATAFKRSAQLLKGTWGEQVIGNFSFGIVFFLLSIPGIVLIAAGFLGGTPVSVALGVGLGVLYLIALGLIQSVLHSIFQAAVYLYAQDGRPPAGFDGALLGDAMRPAER